MKLNKIFTIATLAASALFTTSCSDDVAEYAGPGSWDANANYADVYFPVTSKTDMVDPTADPIATVQVARRNVTNAATVPVKVVEGADIFTVSNAEFAAGDTTAIVTINYSKAEIGKPCKLIMTLEGADYVSSYSANTAYTYTVTRVKWNSLGEGVFTDAYYFEESWPVEILQRDDDKSYYRIVDPYYPTEGEGRSEYLELHVMKKGDQIAGITLSDAGIVDWYRVNTGYINSNYPGDPVWLLNAKNFSSLTSYDYISYNRVTGYNEDGTIGQISLSGYYYLFGQGGGWNATTTPAMIINFPGFVEEYTASLDDYDWEPVFAGEFNSEQLGTKKDGVMLYKGVPNDSIEQANPGCYERYVAKAGGTPYVIEAPYAKGNDLYFVVKNSNIASLVDGTYDFTYQNTGMTALNQKVYANILASSKFADDLISLDIQFQTKPDKNGDFIDYGTANETLANITWSEVGTGTFIYTMWWDGGQDEEGNYLPLVDPGYSLFQRDGSNDTFKITDWGAGVDYIFKWDQKTNVCATQMGFIGESHPTYGEVYVVDASTYSSKNYPYEDYPSQYVPEENTFYFYNAYVVEAGSFGAGLELFKGDWSIEGATPSEATTARAKALKKSKRFANMKPNKNIKAASRFVGKKAKAPKFGRSLGAPQFFGELIAE